MQTKPNARKTALEVLIACRRDGAWADALLGSSIERSGLIGAEAALCSRIVYGVMQQHRLLDYELSFFCTQSLAHLQPPLADILRIGAYQILFLDKVPDHAAVNESVELAKYAGRAAASGLVNAVLRKLSQNKNALPALPEATEERLCVQYSMPLWLVERMERQLGSAEAEKFFRACNEEAPLTVCLNPLKTDAESLVRSLENEQVNVRTHPWAEGCFELTGCGNPRTLSAFRSGELLIQDAAAGLPARLCGIRPGERLLDVCAAPGGKSFTAAFAMRDEGKILACDLHESKLKRIRDGMERLGLHCIETAAADGRCNNPAWNGAFDAVLCDVPCSGLGIIRKKPDVREKNPQELAALPQIQLDILSNAGRYVKPGGTLLYSTCTVLREENEAVTDAFLGQNPEFSYEPFSLPVGEADGRFTLWPHLHGTDGFYLAKMKRKLHD